MFAQHLLYLIPSGAKQMYRKKIIKTGWPMEYASAKLEPFANYEKENLILFPHRLAPEKQLDIFKDLEQQLPQYKFIVCQETQLSKVEYHTLLGRAKLVFSAALQETLGLSMIEAALSNAIPFSPNRLSYSEIFKEHREFLYMSDWTENYDSYTVHKQLLIDSIVNLMDNYNSYVPQLQSFKTDIIPQYFHANNIISTIKDAL
jgi:hypothetical protein